MPEVALQSSQLSCSHTSAVFLELALMQILRAQMSFPLQFLRAQAGGKLETAPKIDAFLNKVEAMESYKVAMEKGGMEFSLNF